MLLHFSRIKKTFPQSSLQSFNVDKLFLGVTGFSLNRGLTTTNLLESEVKQAMIHALVTDSGIPESFIFELEEKGVKVFVTQIDL